MGGRDGSDPSAWQRPQCMARRVLYRSRRSLTALTSVLNLSSMTGFFLTSSQITTSFGGYLGLRPPPTSAM